MKLSSGCVRKLVETSLCLEDAKVCFLRARYERIRVKWLDYGEDAPVKLFTAK